MRKIIDYVLQSQNFFKIALALGMILVALISFSRCEAQVSNLCGVDSVYAVHNPNPKPNSVQYYDARIKTTIILIEAANGAKMARYNVPYIFMRFNYLPDGYTIDSNHVKYYYPDRKTKIRLIYWTNISKDSLDMDSKWIQLHRN